jgi:hypothetical protein
MKTGNTIGSVKYPICFFDFQNNGRRGDGNTIGNEKYLRYRADHERFSITRSTKYSTVQYSAVMLLQLKYCTVHNQIYNQTMDPSVFGMYTQCINN